MPTLQYSDSPNVDTAFVVDGDKKHRAVLTAPQDTSTLELPDNPNSTKGYVTVDGKKHKVILTANIAGGGGGGGAVDSVNGKTGAVVLDAEDVGALPADTTAADLGAVPQYETMPTASADNLGEIAQYSGETHGDTGTATISQTVGSGMTDLAINTQTFIEEEQPTESGNFNFVCTPSVTLGAKEGDFTAEITDVDAFFAELQKHIGSYSLDYVIKNLVIDVWNTGIYYFDSWNVVVSFGDEQASFPATVENGVTITGNPQSSNYQQIDSLGWFKKGNDYVNLDDYGITYGTEKTVTITDHSENVSISSINSTKFYAKYDSIQHTDSPFVEFAYTADGWYFSEQEGVYYTTAEVESEWGVVITGTPVADTDWADMVLGNVADCETGDTLTVALTFTAGATNGYFYKSSATYSDPTATISHTAGQLDAISFETTVGNTTMSGTLDAVKDLEAGSGYTFPTASTITFVYDISVSLWKISVDGHDILDSTENLEGRGFVITGTPADGDTIVCTYSFESISDLAVDLDTFVAEEQPTQSESVTFVAADGGTSWTKGGETVDLADYGITYTGTPVDNDTLTVVYTAPAITGYAWNQINVQPQPVIPEPTDIKWATSIDVPDNYGYPWECFPIYTIAGGLPDGTYDFYWQCKCQTERYVPFGVVTYHARMKIDSTQNTFYGMFEPVVKDEWLPDSQYVPASTQFYTFVRVNSSGDFLLWADGQVWKSDIPAYVPGVAIPECFKISVIKNIDTGVEYTPTGMLYGGSFPESSYALAGSIIMQPFAQEQYIPRYYLTNEFDFDSTQRHLYLGDRRVATSRAFAICSEYDFCAETSSGGKYHIIIENSVDSYVARIIEASGDLATTQIGLYNNFLYFDFNSAGNSGKIKIVIGTKGSDTAPVCWMGEPEGALTSLDIANVGEPVGINNLGLLEQYKGATDANYTNGYFYKSTGTIVNVPSSITCTEYTGHGIDITMDVDAFIAYMQTIGYDKNTIITWLNDPSYFFEYDYDQNIVSWSPYGQLPNTSDVLACFTFSPAVTSGQIVGWRTSNYIPGHQEVQGGAWTRVNVQPLDLTGVTGYDATKTQVLKNVQGTLTWVDE